MTVFYRVKSLPYYGHVACTRSFLNNNKNLLEFSGTTKTTSFPTAGSCMIKYHEARKFEKKTIVILGGILWNTCSRSDTVMPLSESFLSKVNFRRASQPDIAVHSFAYLSLD